VGKHTFWLLRKWDWLKATREQTDQSMEKESAGEMPARSGANGGLNN
jgi:hypothetical protein